MEPVRAHVDRNLFKTGLRYYVISFDFCTKIVQLCASSHASGARLNMFKLRRLRKLVFSLIKRIFGALRLLSCLIRPILHGQACLDLVGKS